MSPVEFTKWLDEYLKAIPTNQLAPIHIQVIKEKLDSVFNKVTPPNKYSTTYCQSVIPTFPDYTLIDNGDKPSGIVWSGQIPTPYLGTQFNQFITC